MGRGYRVRESQRLASAKDDATAIVSTTAGAVSDAHVV